MESILIEVKNKEYDPEFVQKILESSKEAHEGKLITLNIEDLWK